VNDMAETLGSLVDKLTIKNIRRFHIEQMQSDKACKFTRAELREKLRILDDQKRLLTREIDLFAARAASGKIQMRDEKLKLYNARADIGRILPVKAVGEAIAGLSQKNLELWHLEDEARRKDVPLSYIGGIKRRIDLANQQRNDYIDKIDELFEKTIKDARMRGGSKATCQR